MCLHALHSAKLWEDYHPGRSNIGELPTRKRKSDTNGVDEISGPAYNRMGFNDAQELINIPDVHDPRRFAAIGLLEEAAKSVDLLLSNVHDGIAPTGRPMRIVARSDRRLQFGKAKRIVQLGMSISVKTSSSAKV